MGCAFAWKFRHNLKGGFLSGNRTQTGQEHVAYLSHSLNAQDDGLIENARVARPAPLRL